MITRIRPVDLTARGVPVPMRQVQFIPTRLVPGIEMEELAYFAASVIWERGFRSG